MVRAADRPAGSLAVRRRSEKAFALSLLAGQFPRAADGLVAFFARGMHDIERHARHIGDHYRAVRRLPLDSRRAGISVRLGAVVALGAGGDEHGVVADPEGVLKVNDKLRLVPGHCDPTCNVHDWYVGIRNGKVETVWPVSARGKAY